MNIDYYAVKMKINVERKLLALTAQCYITCFYFTLSFLSLFY